MAHGRKRSFIGGVLVGVAFTVGVTITALVTVGFTMGPPGYPHLTERSARACVLEWARLSPFPDEAQSFTITTTGGMFSRSFRIAFFGEPSDIDDWVRSCPGIAHPKTEVTKSQNGTAVYQIAPGGGATFAELIHHPVRGTVSIKTYRS